MKQKNNSIFVNFFKNNKILKKKNLIELKKIFKNSKKNSRICLHKDVNDYHQEMIIIQGKNKFFPPKKNTKSDQTFMIVEGKLMVLTFNSVGKIMSKVILSKNENLMTRVKKNIYHCDIPITNYSIHLETKNCKFNKKTNKLAKFNFKLPKIN